MRWAVNEARRHGATGPDSAGSGGAGSGAAGSGVVPAPSGDEVAAFHASLPGYRPTPLHRLDALADALGVASVHLKDESDRLGLPAFKIVGASWAVECTMRRRPTTRTLLAASAGNHGRAVARAAAMRGLTSRIYLPASASPTRVRLIEAEGATVIQVDGDYDAAVAEAERASEAPETALIADTASGAVDAADLDGPAAWVIDGYGTLFAELSGSFDLVLVPGGVGSFAAAAVRWAAHRQPDASVVAVEPATAACLTASLAAGTPVTVPTPGTSMAGLDCGSPSTVAWPTLRYGLAGALTVDDPPVHRAMRDLAALGLTIGDCGAAPLAALRALVADPAYAALRDAVGLGAASKVLLLATEGASDPDAYARIIGGDGPL